MKAYDKVAMWCPSFFPPFSHLSSPLSTAFFSLSSSISLSLSSTITFCLFLYLSLFALFSFCLRFVFSFISASTRFPLSFLVASTRLYNPLCRSVGLSVGRLVGWSVGRSRHGLVQRRSYNVRLTTESKAGEGGKRETKGPFEIRVRERLGCKKKKVIAARR